VLFECRNFYVINHKVDLRMTYVDLVLVIMAMCPHTLLQVLANTNEKSMN